MPILYFVVAGKGLPGNLLVDCLSDEELVLRWLENPYWQYFCGETHFQNDFPCDEEKIIKIVKSVTVGGTVHDCITIGEKGIKTLVQQGTDF